jgi:hypothetical protein
MKKTVHRDCHLQTLPFSSLLSSTLRLPPPLLLVPPRFLHNSKRSHRRRVHRDRLPHQITPSKLHSSTLRCLPLLAKVPPRNPPRIVVMCCPLHDCARSTGHLNMFLGQRITPLLQELSDLQIKHSSNLRPMWVRRCWNEAADALSKNDMDRFGLNVKGDSR